jgi:hypothetical protein
MRPLDAGHSKPMDSPVPDSDKPDLRSRTTRQESVGRINSLVGHFKISSVDVNCNNPSLIVGLDLRPNAIFINRRADSRMIFFGQSGLPHAHPFPPKPLLSKHA